MSVTAIRHENGLSGDRFADLAQPISTLRVCSVMSVVNRISFVVDFSDRRHVLLPETHKANGVVIRGISPFSLLPPSTQTHTQARAYIFLTPPLPSTLLICCCCPNDAFVRPSSSKEGRLQQPRLLRRSEHTQSDSMVFLLLPRERELDGRECASSLQRIRDRVEREREGMEWKAGGEISGGDYAKHVASSLAKDGRDRTRATAAANKRTGHTDDDDDDRYTMCVSF